MKYIDEFKNPDAARGISEEIKRLASQLPEGRIYNIMEVCGSHTMAIARYAIKDLLPENIDLISGPGCPVCVTDSGYIDTSIELALRDNVIIATFGDMVNVPGEVQFASSKAGAGQSSEVGIISFAAGGTYRMSEQGQSQGGATLAKIRGEGANVEVCYSPMKAIELAKGHPEKEVVFLAIGFETTAAPVVSLVDIAVNEKIENISILTAFKLVPPALEALVADPELNVDAFLCPAHVSAVIGVKAYEPFVEKHEIPCVIASFEPVDIFFGIQKILEQIVNNEAFVDNQYKRVVRHDGNPAAQRILDKYLEVADVAWRGIGVIPDSGMKLRSEFRKYDTEYRFGIKIRTGTPDKRCQCGDVLKGKIKPDQCAMFAKACTPLNPIGPCMVSSEGACAAWYKYK